LHEEDITDEIFVKTIDDTFKNRSDFVATMTKNATAGDGAKQIVEIINSVI